MKKLFSFLLLPALIFSGCKAQKKTDDKSLLWRVSGKGLSQPSYVFGTIHLLCPDDYVWTDAMRKSLKSCKEVCFELDMDDPAVLMSAMSDIKSADGKPLKSYFAPDEYERLDHFVKDTLHADLAQMQEMKPVMLQSLFMMKAVSCAMPVSYEANIMLEAKKDKKEIVGLELPKEQTDLLNSLPDDTVAKSLIQMTDSFAASKMQYQQMLSAYKAQDLPALFHIIQDSKELGDDMSAFLDERNKRWIPRMKPKMEKAPVFFAVGAGHLWGDNGVISLLRKAGYIVEPIK